MKFITQSFKLLTSLDEVATPKGNISIMKHLERVARYKSESKITKDESSAEELIRKLVLRNHWAMLEFFDVTIQFITNRGVTHELVRHRLASFAQESTRYVRYGHGCTFVIPAWFEHKKEVLDMDLVLYKNIAIDEDEYGLKQSGLNADEYDYLKTLIDLEDTYRTMLINGKSPQQARGILPNDLATTINVKANLREWKHIFDLRCSPKAHPDMIECMKPVEQLFKEKLPIIFDMLLT